jgi:hypothetical protein
MSKQKRTVSELQDRVTELIEQQTAISEVLRDVGQCARDKTGPR